MAYSKKDSKKRNHVYTDIMGETEIPKFHLSKDSIPEETAYRILKDELLDEGNARLNLATFCQTFMDDRGTQLISETLGKNAIDKSEYPRTAEIEKRCVNIIADLWNAPQNANFLGTSTIGSSEGSMLAGMAMKFSWRNKTIEKGIYDPNIKPNLIISAGYQVCWEKFATYWDVELRVVPLSTDTYTLDIDALPKYIDEYTIGIVAILGVTYIGNYDDVEKMDQMIEKYNNKNNRSIPIHVDGASGGFYAPFENPTLKWDFSLKNVVSINASGHKYGLIYPGVGWVLWRDTKYLPKELLFDVSYLGGSVPTFSINFSKSASPIIGQYYNFLRLGFYGYANIHIKTKKVAKYISEKILQTGKFNIIHDASDLPVIAYSLKEDSSRNWNLYDLSDRLLMKGWQVPTYPLPAPSNDVIVQRIVCRADLSDDLGDILIDDFKVALKFLEDNNYSLNSDLQNSKGFTH